MEIEVPLDFSQRRRLIPDPFASMEDWYRYHHLDLPYLSLEDIESEASLIAGAMYFTPPRGKASWLLERYQALREEIRKRRRHER
jgi:hypothetical protein